MSKQHPVSKPTFTTLEEIKKYGWHGNAWLDMPAFEAVDEFIRNEANSEEDRAEAYNQMGILAMGATCMREDGYSTAEILAEWKEGEE